MPDLKKNAEPSNGREVLYPDLEVCGIKIPVENTWYDCDQIKTFLGWEDEDELRARVAESAKDVLSKLKEADRDKALDRLVAKEIDDGGPHTLIDEDGKRVWLRNNTSNRPYDDQLSKSYTQDMLNREWQFNGESWIVGKTGLDLSLQHRGTGFVRACQLWHKQNAHWIGKWPEEPKLQILMVCGIEETPAIIATLDNVRSRSLADTLHTQLREHKLFKNIEGSDFKLVCKMADAAIDAFWKRTHANEGDSDRKYQTHSSSLAMKDRHPKLLVAVKHLYEENKSDAGRAISTLGLSPGKSAALMYLMAAGKTDGDAYRNARPVPSEKKVDLDLWGKAEEFWTLLAAREKSLKPLVEALADLPQLPGKTDGKEGLGGTSAERYGLVVKAWKFFVAGQKFTADDIKLAYAINEACEVKLVEFPTLDGIDLGDHKSDGRNSESGGEPDAEKVEETKAEVRAKKAKDAEATVKASSNGKPALADEVAEAIAKAPGKLMIFRGTVACTIFGEQADKAGKHLQAKVTKSNGISRIDFNPTNLEANVSMLQKAGHEVVIRHSDGTILPAKARPDDGKPADLPTKALKKPLNKGNGKPKPAPAKA